jgi:hypothetical protein
VTMKVHVTWPNGASQLFKDIDDVKPRFTDSAGDLGELALIKLDGEKRHTIGVCYGISSYIVELDG